MHVGAPYDFVFFQPVDVNSTQYSNCTQGILGVENVVQDALEIVRVVGVPQLVLEVFRVA